MLRQSPRPGFTLTELLVLLALVVVSIAMMVTCGGSQDPQQSAETPADEQSLEPPRDSASLKDMEHIKLLHFAMRVYSNEHNGRFPIPGLIDRLADEYTGMELRDSGPEDFSQNHTAALYSALIAQEFFTPGLLISPVEVNPAVREILDYDFSRYDPANDSYWDPRFVARIDDPKIGCNTSYAHLAIAGPRKEDYWREVTPGNRVAMIGTRGTSDGTTEGDEYTRSPTLRFFAPDNKWGGNIVFSDNSTQFIRTFTPDEATYFDGANEVPDNIFNPDGKAFLCISIAADEFSVEDVYDPLFPLSER